MLCQAQGRTLLAIDRLTVMRGERLAIVGANGAGKSTLLRLLSGFLPPASGALEVLGRRMDSPLPPRELRALRVEVGQVMQGLHLVGRLSARANVLIGSLGRASGWRSWLRCFPADELTRAAGALHSVGLLARADTRADRLSGGERQKVAIARLLLQRPRLILADEPTAALDPAAAAEVCRLLADRVIGLRLGRIAFDLPVAQVDERRLVDLYRPVAGDEASPRPASAAIDPPARLAALS